MLLDAGTVILRPFVESDHGSLVEVLTSPNVMRLALYERALSRDEAAQFMDSHFNAPELGFGTVEVKETGEIAGFAGYRACDYLGHADVEFGWVLSETHHGRGYATALGEQLIRQALRSLGFSRVLAACNPRNDASRHVLQDKLRMTFVREVEPKKGFRRMVFRANENWIRG
jgi:RimJ/RimL family protein N-acetyltransferase